eukprot:5816660-Amphidinium_carterae.1
MGFANQSHGHLWMDTRNATNATCSWKEHGEGTSLQKLLPPTLFYLGFGHVGSTTMAEVLNDHPLV